MKDTVKKPWRRRSRGLGPNHRIGEWKIQTIEKNQPCKKKKRNSHGLCTFQVTKGSLVKRTNSVGKSWCPDVIQKTSKQFFKKRTSNVDARKKSHEKEHVVRGGGSWVKQHSNNTREMMNPGGALGLNTLCQEKGGIPWGHTQKWHRRLSNRSMIFPPGMRKGGTLLQGENSNEQPHSTKTKWTRSALKYKTGFKKGKSGKVSVEELFQELLV